MLYQLYETQRAMLSPFAEFASASSKLLQPPAVAVCAHTDGRSRVRRPGPGSVRRLSKEYEKPQFSTRHRQRGGVDVAVQQQVAMEKPFCRLLRFKRFTDNLQALSQNGAPDGADRGAAVGPPLDAAA